MEKIDIPIKVEATLYEKSSDSYFSDTEIDNFRNSLNMLIKNGDKFYELLEEHGIVYEDGKLNPKIVKQYHLKLE